MATNPFIVAPVRVVILDPVKNINRRTFVFLGDVPKKIQTAVNNYNAAKDRTNYDNDLKEFYGSDYKTKLGLDIKDYSKAFLNTQQDEKDGGGSFDSISIQNELDMEKFMMSNAVNGSEAEEMHGGVVDDELDLDNIEDLLKLETPKDIKEIARSHTKIISNVSDNELKVDFKPGIEFVQNIHIYPEDKFNELKEKVYLATNIPTYRQHVFYVDRNHVQSTYKLWAEGIYTIDIRNLMSYTDNILGIPIDKFLYDVREDIRVEAMDMFIILTNVLNISRTVYVVDLQQFTHNLQSQIVNIINDTYQIDLFYYGFILKYWPQLTRECFYDYITNESELQHKYPDLAKNKSALANIYDAEKQIIDYNYQNLVRAMSWGANNGVTIAITQMIATVSGNRVQLNIRNLFDKLRVTRCIPEIYAYIEYNGKRFLLRKRHVKNASDIQFPSGNLMKNGIILAISLRKSDQESFHAKSSISTMENEQSRFLFLNIWANGKYYVRTVWNEEDELGFDDIMRVMKKFTDPIINGINSLGRYVFINGTSIPLISKQNINYQGLNICVFWKKVLLEGTFKFIKYLWDDYMRARITGPRNVQQFDKFEFLFRKGMYDFDITAIDRIITASNNITLNNYYAHLSNNAIKQKWDQNYDGRIVKMSHRTTAIKFEVSDIREQEFLLFFHYIVLFCYKAINDERVKQAITETKTYVNTKKLRKLREQDPELFNLKKHGSKKVYSILCQNQRQPLIYTTDEIKTMTQQDVKKLTQYWNFTLNKPAYYGCPNSKYPHLSFTVDAHPKHYCLPCCSKAMSNEDSKKTRITSICLAKHRHSLTEAYVDGPSSRHIMNYGKDIDIGRLSKLPNSSIKNLLYNTLANPHQNYYLFGTAQNVPAVNNIGIIYAIAEAVEIGMEELIKRLIDELHKTTSTNLFSLLINGALVEYFHNMEDVIVSIKELFLDMKMISREYQKFKHWPELFTELFHILFKISVFTFIDETGTGEVVDLFVPDIFKSEISYINKMSEAENNSHDKSFHLRHSLVSNVMSGHKYVLIIKKQNRYYPIFVIDSENYFKTFNIEQRWYKYEDKVIKLLYNMVLFNERREKTKVEQKINLVVVKEFIIENSKYRIEHKYVNRQNLCYALLLKTFEGTKHIYMPINYSVHITDEIPIHFDPFDRQKITLEYGVLDQFMADFNKFLDVNYRIGHIFTYSLISVAEYVAIPSSSGLADSLQIIGFSAPNSLIYYFNKFEAGQIQADKPVKNIHYDYNEINRLIINRVGPVADNRSLLIGEALYNNYIYQLFLIEFINFLDRERNHVIRNKLKELIMATNFRKGIGEFIKEIRKLLYVQYPTDFALFHQQLIGFYYTNTKKEDMLKRIDTVVYEFDHITMNKLKKLNKNDIRAELREIAKTFSVQKDFDTSGIQFPNIYLPCSDIETEYCDNKKLIVNRNIDDLIDILATDIMDDLKAKYLMTALFGDNIIDYLKFTQYPTEIVTIYKLSE